MPGSSAASENAGLDAALIGRNAELSQLRRLVDPPPAESRVLVLLGDAGMGKTALLAAMAGQARRAGMRVLPVTGIESERDLAFAGLHQLVRPVLSRIAGLPERQAKALLGALALSADPVPPDALLTGMAVLTLLFDLSEDGPLLITVDDAQWLDRGSLSTLAFVARRLDAEPVVLLLAARGTVPRPASSVISLSCRCRRSATRTRPGSWTRSPSRRGAGPGNWSWPRRPATRWH